MGRLKHQLPPLGALLAFEATARLSSLSRAAQELNVTQPAISRQLKLLEQDLGMPLYVRHNRGVELTPPGRELFDSISLGFNHILSTVDKIRGRRRVGGVVIGATIGFATFWLMPKLNEFRMEHPDVELRVVASDQDVDFSVDNVDVAIRFGTGDWPGIVATQLLEGEAFPVCSRRFLQERALTDARDLLHVPLLDFSDVNSRWMPWRAWFDAAGINAADLRPHIHFNNYPLVIQAAIDGQGMAIGWRHLLDSHLERGELVRPLDVSVKTQDTFWLVRPSRRPVHDDVETLWKWLIGLTARESRPKSTPKDTPRHVNAVSA
jgi:LysR family glycine cleavage system transcriptional activator